MSDQDQILESVTKGDYKYGFVSDIEQEFATKGLSEDTVRFISAKKNEPEFMLEWRLKAYHHWLNMKEPTWANLKYPPIDYQDIIYYAAPKKKKELESLDDLDPEIKSTYDKLGIPLEEQKLLAGVAVDAVMDSVSVATTYKKELAKHGIIFCSVSEAVQNHQSLLKNISAPLCRSRIIFSPH